MFVIGSGCGARSALHDSDASMDHAANHAILADHTLPVDSNTKRFALRFFSTRLGTIYSYETLLSKTTNLDPDGAAITLHESDIARYRVDSAPSKRIQIELTEAAQMRWSTALDALKMQGAFTVSLDGKLLYVGLIYTLYGAAAIDTPIISAGFHDPGSSPGILKIGAQAMAWQMRDDWDSDPGMIDRPELRTLFATRGALDSL